MAVWASPVPPSDQKVGFVSPFYASLSEGLALRDEAQIPKDSYEGDPQASPKHAPDSTLIVVQECLQSRVT